MNWIRNTFSHRVIETRRKRQRIKILRILYFLCASGPCGLMRLKHKRHGDTEKMQKRLKSLYINISLRLRASAVKCISNIEITESRRNADKVSLQNIQKYLCASVPLWLFIPYMRSNLTTTPTLRTSPKESGVLRTTPQHS
jgi:hypothetical protein